MSVLFEKKGAWREGKPLMDSPMRKSVATFQKLATSNTPLLYFVVGVDRAERAILQIQNNSAFLTSKRIKCREVDENARGITGQSA